jgi:hypothetical protein
VISRYSIVCPGCDVPFVVRFGLAPTKITRFYVPCPNCKLPIRGRSFGDDLDTHKVEFDTKMIYVDPEPDLVVTVDPNVPSRYEASEMGGLGTAPTMTLVSLVGDDRMFDLMKVMGGGRGAVEQLWPQVRRIFEYYLEGDWERFDRVGRQALEDTWPDPTTTHERATVANQLLGHVLKEIVGPDEHMASSMFLNRWLRKHSRALEYSKYVELARSEVAAGITQRVQRAVFDTLDHFVGQYDSWQMGLLLRIIPDERTQLLDGLRIFRDEFAVLRDLYQQGFETVCKTLRYPIAAQNTVKRHDPHDFGPTVPATLTRRRNPRDIAEFDSRLSNYEKLQYVAQIPGCERWVALLDNRTRNAIGHASVRHDLRTGLVISDEVPDGVTYLNVMADVFGMFDALSICVQILRGIRIVASPDFQSQSDSKSEAVRRELGLA